MSNFAFLAAEFPALHQGRWRPSIDACLDPAYARIVIQEALAVLGSARTREIEQAYTMALLTATLTALQRQGELDFEDIDLLSRMVAHSDEGDHSFRRMATTYSDR